LHDHVEGQIDEVGKLINAERYSDADKLLSQIERDYPSLVNLGVCGASQRSATDKIGDSDKIGDRLIIP
jgi:hypothetical protein